MMHTRHHGGFIIFLSFALAMLLTILPLPDWLAKLRPDWIGLTLIFWVLMLPDRIGITTGFVSGLFLDVLSGALLGQHALSFSIIAYVCARLHQRIRVYPLWQQALTVLVLLLLHQLITLWVDSTIGRPARTIGYWAPAFIGMLLWPFVLRFLNAARINYSVQ